MHRRGTVQLGAVPPQEFLTNCREAQEEGKTFHYAWFLLSILLVTGELPEDSQFPSLD